MSGPRHAWWRRAAAGLAGLAALGAVATFVVRDAPRAAAPRPPAGATGAATAGPTVDTTLFGTSVPRRKDETLAQTVARIRQTYGRLPVARVYAGQPPKRWDEVPTLAALGAGSDVVVSFGGDKDALAAGRFDADLTAFLQSRPPGVKAWVVLSHEPEAEVAKGLYTPAQFRAATAHIAPVIRAAGGIPTTILMRYTLAQGDKAPHDWREYYTPEIDVLAWDGYNKPGQQRGVTDYQPVAQFLRPILDVARETGKPFGFGEIGSPCAPDDPDCSGRARWLEALGKALVAEHAQFAIYWDRPSFDGKLVFTLSDGSQSVWRGFTSG